MVGAQWWSCGEEILLCHKEGLSVNQARGRRCEHSRRGSERSGVATEHDLYENIGDIDVYTEFEMLKVKVPIIFSGT